MEATIEVSEKFLETCAIGTLAGTILTKYPSFFEAMEMKLVLVFPTSSLSHCRKNGGPRSLLMCDYTPMCLVADVVGLIAMGVEIEVKEEKRD